MIRFAIPLVAIVGLIAITTQLAGTQGPAPRLLVTGRSITPQGKQTEVGSFPCNMILSPDGRFVIVSDAGYRQYLTVLSAEDGHVVDQVPFNRNRDGLYYGLAFGRETNGGWPLYVSRGAQDRISVYSLSQGGKLTSGGPPVNDTSGVSDAPHHVAGLALSDDGRRLYAINNNTGPSSDMHGSLTVINPAANLVVSKIPLAGFPYAVVARGSDANSRAYVTSERDGTVQEVDTVEGRVVREIRTGANPIGLTFNRDQTKLFVANAGSDTITEIDTKSGMAVSTILVRPDEMRGLPGATPTSIAVDLFDRRLYVTLADLNAVGVVDIQQRKLVGLIPAGWYPTAVVITPDGKRLFVANAKGVNERNPNGKDVRAWGRYIENIVEGTVSMIDLPDDETLRRMTTQALANAFPGSRTGPARTRGLAVLPRGIEHVIYIIKENRTYDQVLGDLPQGNGDPALCLFPREVTPNQHALAERFVLLDNFYCCAEVSADGWNWSTSGMANEYTQRNTPYNYSRRGRRYDFEGQNNLVPVDLQGLPDVARAPGGYIWDAVARKGLSYRNYGCFLSFVGEADRGPEGKPIAINNAPNKRALVGHTDEDFLQFDMSYADSDAWVKLDAACPKQKKTYGRFNAPSRFAEWKREFDEFVRAGNLPRFTIMRFPRDHTSGTTFDLHSPRAMVADNDHAVGQLVETVSRSPYWKKTAIFILEDDAQNGHDHVDAHRSIGFVISPFVKKGTVDHRFYNTDSVLRTMEQLLGVSPMCQYDAIAPPLAVFGDKPDNGVPYSAILPERRIAAEVNQRTAYRARDSARMNFTRADSIDDDDLNDILWHAVRGRSAPEPAARFGLRLATSPVDGESGQRSLSAGGRR